MHGNPLTRESRMDWYISWTDTWKLCYSIVRETLIFIFPGLQPAIRRLKPSNSVCTAPGSIFLQMCGSYNNAISRLFPTIPLSVRSTFGSRRRWNAITWVASNSSVRVARHKLLFDLVCDIAFLSLLSHSLFLSSIAALSLICNLSHYGHSLV